MTQLHAFADQHQRLWIYDPSRNNYSHDTGAEQLVLADLVSLEECGPLTRHEVKSVICGNCDCNYLDVLAPLMESGCPWCGHQPAKVTR